jgi:hypothetical protein
MVNTTICLCDSPIEGESWSSTAIGGGWWTKCSRCGGFIDYIGEVHNTWASRSGETDGAERVVLIRDEKGARYERISLR